MENASKALIIAGAILLAILIISLGIMIFRQASGVVDSNAMDEVAAGKIYLPTALTSRFFEYFQNSFKEETRISSEENLLTYLTAREEEVLDLLTQGNNYKSIAGKLFISETTVKTHVNNIFQKLQVNDRTQAVLYALNNGFANRRLSKIAV